MGFYHHFNIKKKTIPYVHAHVMFNRKNNEQFLKDWYQMTLKINGANYDETALNLMYWKYNAIHTACLYDVPHFFYYTNELVKNVIPQPIIDLMFHGNKK
jgi:hypothetical protein